MPASQTQPPWKNINRSGAIFACVVLGTLIFALPLQHYYPMGRFQHYSIGIFVIGLGYLIQLGTSWRKFPFWGRFSCVITFLFFFTIAFVFWTNPWLDPKVNVQTAEREALRADFINGYIIAATVTIVSWMSWWWQEQTIKAKLDAAAKTGTQSDVSATADSGGDAG